MRRLRIRRACATISIAIAALGSEAATLDEMHNLGTVSFCLNPDAMPYSQRDADTDGPGHGFLHDISIELARRLGLSARFIWLNSLERLNKTECDVVPSALIEADELEPQARRLQDEPARVRNRLFTRPYACAGGFLVARDGRYDSFESLKAAHVAVPSGSYAQVTLNRIGVPIWVRFLSDEEIIEAVLTHEAGAGLVTRTGYEWYRYRHPDPGLTRLPIDCSEFQLDSDIGMMLRGADAATLARIDELLAQMVADGAIADAMSRYGVSHCRPAR